MIEVKRVKAIPGCYGERVYVNKNDHEVYDFFRLITLWANNYYFDADGKLIYILEFPLGMSLDDKYPAIELALQRMNVKIVDI